MSTCGDGLIGHPILPPPSLPNPNAHRNRAPAKGELLGLQTFVDTNSRIIGMLDGEIENLRDSYNALQARYIRQQMELEATLSELHKANDLLVAVQKQRAALQMEQDDLHALMHPIRRCPDDILKEIFEMTVVELNYEFDDGERTKQAIRCSSVCQRWRVIALEVPRLWTNLSLDLRDSLEDQIFLRDYMIPRVKQVASNVVVWGIAGDCLPTLKLCGLQNIPVIDTLHLQLGLSRDAHSLMDPNFIPPMRPIRALWIYAAGWDPESDTEQEAEKVDTIRLLNRFPPINTLTLESLPGFFFPTNLVNASIFSLRLDSMGEVNIVGVLECFPHLQSLKIENSQLVVGRAQDVLLAHSVKEVELRNTTGKQWMERVAFPLLEALTYYGGATGALLAFLSAHRSLHKLVSDLKGNIISKLAEKAPQLQELEIFPPVEGFCRPLDGSSVLPFPSLKSLTISCVGLTLEGFDGLIRARCLPIRHPKSQAKQQSDVIAVFAIATETYGPPTSATWGQSELYKESTKKIEGLYSKKVYLSWPDWE